MRSVNGSFNSSITAITQSEPEAVPQQGTTPPPINTGIGGTSDGFESANRSTNPGPDFNQKETPNFHQALTGADPTVDPSEVFNYFGAPSAEPTPPQPQEIGSNGVETQGSSDLSSILNDPNLPYEEKMALFLFEFLEKAEKDLLAQMSQLDKSRNAQKSTGGVNGNQGTTGQGGVNGNQGSEAQAPINGQNTESEQIGMEKLKLAHEKMTKMFSIVDNILTSLNRTVKDGPIAALKG